jgi:poly(A)-specific ribonuclease
MDIDRYSFPGRAFEILEAIAASAFVTIDCEFSGVSRSQARGMTQSLEERYAETKKAAKKYHILQVGITCTGLLSNDPQDYFCLRPYNFSISPVINEELGVERDFAFQAVAVEFLLRNNFSFGQSLSAGVRYLSRAEEAEAMVIAETKTLKMNFEDIVLSDHDIEALELVEEVRTEISNWTSTGRPNSYTLTIRSRKSVKMWSESRHNIRVPPDLELTSFDRRLIHQLVRTEFPELRTMTKSGNIIVVRYDAKRESDAATSRLKKAKRMVQENIGFRWIVEALFCGADNLKRLDPKATGMLDVNVANGTTTGSPVSYYELVRRRTGIAEKLRNHPVVLVGHNLFGDLAYLYQHFIGELPETLEGFRQIVHQAMPLVIDTKYMATHNCGNTQPPSSLEQLHESLKSYKEPGYGIPVGFEKYLEKNSNDQTSSTGQYLHEAGYDGYVTAQILLKLTSKLGGSVLDVESAFWQEYGNRLRVFGTTEAMFDLARPVHLPVTPVKVTSEIKSNGGSVRSR